MIPIYSIIAITAIMSVSAFQSAELMDRWIMRPYSVRHGNQWYRFITSGFIHANWPHLLINMLVFYSFGLLVYHYYVIHFESKALFYFVMLYLGGMVIADLPTYIKHSNDSWYASLGASGAVSAVLFASIFFDPWGQILLYFIPMPGIIMGVIYLLYSAYMSKRGGDNINHDAHFYGAIFGVVFTLLLQPSLGLLFIQRLLQPHF